MQKIIKETLLLIVKVCSVNVCWEYSSLVPDAEHIALEKQITAIVSFRTPCYVM